MSSSSTKNLEHLIKSGETLADFPHLSRVKQLQAAVSRYNGGHQLAPPKSDEGATGGDYMNDVWARARFYARIEQWSVEGSS